MDEKLCVSVDQLAERLGICRMGAYALARSQGFPSITLGRRILIPVASLEKWLDEQARDQATVAAAGGR